MIDQKNILRLFRIARRRPGHAAGQRAMFGRSAGQAYFGEARSVSSPKHYPKNVDTPPDSFWEDSTLHGRSTFRLGFRYCPLALRQRVPRPPGFGSETVGAENPQFASVVSSNIPKGFGTLDRSTLTFLLRAMTVERNSVLPSNFGRRAPKPNRFGTTRNRGSGVAKSPINQELTVCLR